MAENSGMRVLNKYHDGLPSNSVYIGRPSKWGNPFEIGKDGTREEVIAKFEAYLLTRPDLVQEAIIALYGKDLVCYCAPKACHGDVWMKFIYARPFRLLITGSRSWGVEWSDNQRLMAALDKVIDAVGYRNPVLIHGGAKGADLTASFYWAAGGHTFEVYRWDDTWAEFGKQGGMKRNEYMVNLGANLCLAFIRDYSSGATHCANYAESKGIKTIRFRA